MFSQILASVQQALPTALIVLVVCLGIFWAARTSKGREAISEIALGILRAIANGYELPVLQKLDRTTVHIESKLTPFERTARRAARRSL